MGRLRELFEEKPKVSKEEADRKFFGAQTPPFITKDLLEKMLEDRRRKYERSPNYKRTKKETAV